MTGKVYLDSNIVIYYIEGSLSRKAQVRRLLTEHAGHGDRLFTSEITIGECLIGVYKKVPMHEDAYLSLFQDAEFVSLHAISAQIVQRAAHLGADLNMKLVDAIHVASAEALGCRVSITNDRGIRAPVGIELRYLPAEA